MGITNWCHKTDMLFGHPGSFSTAPCQVKDVYFKAEPAQRLQNQFTEFVLTKGIIIIFYFLFIYLFLRGNARHKADIVASANDEAARFLALSYVQLRVTKNLCTRGSNASSLTLRRRIKSHLLFAGIIRSSPFSLR